LHASVNQQEVSGEGDASKRKYSILLPSPLPSPFVDLHSRMQVSYVSVSTYFTSVNWPLAVLNLEIIPTSAILSFFEISKQKNVYANAYHKFDKMFVFIPGTITNAKSILIQDWF